MRIRRHFSAPAPTAVRTPEEWVCPLHPNSPRANGTLIPLIACPFIDPVRPCLEPTPIEWKIRGVGTSRTSVPNRSQSAATSRRHRRAYAPASQRRRPWPFPASRLDRGTQKAGKRPHISWLFANALFACVACVGVAAISSNSRCVYLSRVRRCRRPQPYTARHRSETVFSHTFFERNRPGKFPQPANHALAAPPTRVNAPTQRSSAPNAGTGVFRAFDSLRFRAFRCTRLSAVPAYGPCRD